MKAFVINLKERTDRMELFKENKFPFDIERFDAIRTDPGWVGCTQSHLTILQKPVQEPLFILEDDVILLKPWEEIENIINQLPDDWDALWLGGNIFGSLTPVTDDIYKVVGCFAAHAIIFKTRRIIDYIINNHVKYFESTDRRKTIDVFYCFDVQPKFNCYLTFAATQRTGYSDIEKVYTDYSSIINKKP